MLEFILIPYDVDENHITTYADTFKFCQFRASLLEDVLLVFLRTTGMLTGSKDSLDSLFRILGKPTDKY